MKKIILLSANLVVVTRENIIKFKNIDFMGFYVFEIDNF